MSFFIKIKHLSPDPCLFILKATLSLTVFQLSTLKLGLKIYKIADKTLRLNKPDIYTSLSHTHTHTHTHIPIKTCETNIHTAVVTHESMT